MMCPCPPPPQGGKSVEVRPVGITKGLAMQRIIATIAEMYGADKVHFDMVLCIGEGKVHFDMVLCIGR